MQVRRRQLAAVLGALAVGTAEAQTFNQPSDVELSAIYCIGLFNQQLEDAYKNSARSQPETIRQLDRTTAATRDQLDRLRTYMLPRFGYLDATGLMLAIARGTTDAKSYSAAVDAMSQECERTSGTAMSQVACVQESIRRYHADAGGLGARVLRCRRLEFLPF